MAYFQISESNSDQLCQKTARINREIEHESPNADLEEAGKEAEQVLQRINLHR